jgi:protein CWC15
MPPYLNPLPLHCCTRSQPGQTAAVDVATRDLRAELRLAEHTAKNKKRKAAGLAPLPFTAGPAMAVIEAPPADAEMGGDAEDPAAKRRKILEDALALDRDDEDDEDEDGPAASVSGAGAAADADGDSAMAGPGAASNTAADAAADDDDDDEDDEDDDEDETAQLLRELEKIKRERAAEQARVAAASDASAAADHEAEVARANPLLNLAAALGADTPKGVSTTVPGTFAVKRRWDDGACTGRRVRGSEGLTVRRRCRRDLQEPGDEPEG